MPFFFLIFMIQIEINIFPFKVPPEFVRQVKQYINILVAFDFVAVNARNIFTHEDINNIL